MRKQVGRVLAAVAVLGAVVSGCGGPAQSGAAVIVGDTSESLESVQAQLAAALRRVPPAAAKQDTAAGVARDLVTNEVVGGLLNREAAAAGIVVTDAQVDAFIAQGGGAATLLQNTYLDEPGLRQQVHDSLIAVELGRRAAGSTQVTADLVGAMSREEAQDAAQKLAAGGPAADELFRDPARAKRDVVFSATANPSGESTPVFGTSPGGAGFFQPDPQQATWLAYLVTANRTGVAADPAALARISQDDLRSIGLRTLQPVAERLGVRVNPRYGVWDPITLRVVAADQVSGAVLPAGAG